MEHKNDSDTNCNSSARYNQQRVDKGTGGLGNKWTSGDHPNDSIIKMVNNTEKSPGDMTGTCRHSNSNEKSSANARMKNSRKCKIIQITFLTNQNHR